MNKYKKIDLEELRKIIYNSWYEISHQKQYDEMYGGGKSKEDYLTRELIIKEINDNYGQLATVYFSLNGSPPKGRAILMIKDEIDKDHWNGDLLLIGRKNKLIMDVTIKKEENN